MLLKRTFSRVQCVRKRLRVGTQACHIGETQNYGLLHRSSIQCLKITDFGTNRKLMAYATSYSWLIPTYVPVLSCTVPSYGWLLVRKAMGNGEGNEVGVWSRGLRRAAAAATDKIQSARQTPPSPKMLGPRRRESAAPRPCPEYRYKLQTRSDDTQSRLYRRLHRWQWC